MTTTHSIQTVFNSGDYVKTSKGNVGIIIRPERWYIVEEDGTPVYTDLDPNRTLEDIHNNVLIHWVNRFDVKTHGRKAVKLPNLVKLGYKEFEIWSNKLVLLDKLNIRTQQGMSQHVTVLPVEDAKIIIDIYTRNKIWFNIE